jgi:hypothetical protein
MTGSQRNIKRVLDLADSVDIDEGRLSFFRYHEVLRNMSAHYGVDFQTTVAIFCALSPNSDYRGNLRSTASVIAGHLAGIDRDRIRVATYNHCRDRAFEYLNGTSFLATVRGPKIRSFYLNIINPMDPDPVTIDGHAVNIWRGRRKNLKSVVGDFRYKHVAGEYRDVARRVGLLPNQVQAITWFAWKRIHRILYPGEQLKLFGDPGDRWETLADPASVIPFPFLETPLPSTLPAGRKPGHLEQLANEKKEN